MRKAIKIVTFYDDGTFTEATPSNGLMPTYPAPNHPIFHPPYYPPTNHPVPSWPSNPNTITCKMEDGSLKEIVTGPIYAQGVRGNTHD